MTPWWIRWMRGALQALGAVMALAILAALLGLPWPVYRWLYEVDAGVDGAPDVIVMMGGGGIPSESGLTRAWQTAREAARFPKARVVVAMPFEPGEGGTNRSAVVRELMLRGVSEARLEQEGQGRHTREQALRLRAMLEGRQDQVRVLVVTSPEHVRRSVLAFRKAGLAKVRGRPVLQQELKADLVYGEKPSLKDLKSDSLIGHSLMLRYRFWDNLLLEIKVARELAALAYYKAKGWI